MLITAWLQSGIYYEIQAFAGVPACHAEHAAMPDSITNNGALA